jgi:hypothetical protein
MSQRIVRTIGIAIILALGGSLVADDYHFPIDTIDHTLNYIDIDTSDITFRTDYVDRDSFRLKIIDDLTLRPLQIPDYLKRRGDILKDTSISVFKKYDSLEQTLGRHPRRQLMGNWQIDLKKVYLDARERGGVIGELADHLLKTYVGISYAANIPLTEGLSIAESAFVADSFLTFLQEEEKSISRPLEELDSIQKLGDSLAISFKTVGPKINIANILDASRQLVSDYQQLAAWLSANKTALQQVPDSLIIRCFYTLKTNCGPIAVGGKGNDRYEGDYAIIIDFGGNDEYLLSRKADHRFQIIIDMGGDDRYLAQSDHCFGAGFLGCSILDDWEGNDTYLAENYSLGCGIFGTGILIDRAGDDTYIGNIGCQAASSFGVGMLLDYGGRDSYSAALYSQGFGYILGSSALVDYNGNDRYTVGWKYGDILRYEDHYISLSQGFGYGLRPYFSGGVGLLIDGEGNDLYCSDIFGQGASYWWSLGGLVDYAGNDQYISYQYAQGNGTHLSLGALVDISGDDLYSSKGVSQGCGHDLAFGLLLDCAGNDQYNAYDLSQAAGSANGIGMLIDLKGDDAYMARVKANTHGYGNPRREYGSIGLLLDLSGQDFYRGYGEDDSYWVTQSKWGIGADLNSVKPDTTKAKQSGK